MPVRGTPCTGTCDRPVETLWVIEPCAYPVRVSVFSQGSCRAVLCLGVLPHACTLSKCAPLDYTLVCVALDFLCRCKRLHAVSSLWDCSGQYFPPVCVSFGWGRVYLKMHTIYLWKATKIIIFSYPFFPLCGPDDTLYHSCAIRRSNAFRAQKV